MSGWPEGNRGGEAEDGMKGRAAGSDSDCGSHPQNFAGQRGEGPDYWAVLGVEELGLVHVVQMDHFHCGRN